MNLDGGDLSIGEVARRTGISVSTLRMWEARYGFPAPRRLNGRHRRYRDDDCRLLLEVKRLREDGRSMRIAIRDARRQDATADTSIFAGVRRRYPDAPLLVAPEPVLLAISRAIEDDVHAHARGALLVGAFQRRAAWHVARPRWLQLARSATLAVVLADFEEPTFVDGVWQVPFEAGLPVESEWAVISDAPYATACLVGRERLGAVPRQPRRRTFEAVWSLDPAVVRDAARLGIGIAARAAPELREAAAPRLINRVSTGREFGAHATTVTNLILTNLLHDAERRRRPVPR